MLLILTEDLGRPPAFLRPVWCWREILSDQKKTDFSATAIYLSSLIPRDFKAGQMCSKVLSLVILQQLSVCFCAESLLPSGTTDLRSWTRLSTNNLNKSSISI